MQLIHPCPTGTPTDGFGPRPSYDLDGDGRGDTRPFHDGQDWAAPTGTPILAAHEGVVTHAGWYGDYGYLVILDRGDGWETWYAHQATPPTVAESWHVEAGDQLGVVGSTGKSTGPHLHFELHRHGTPVDPIPYLTGALNPEQATDPEGEEEPMKAIYYKDGRTYYVCIFHPVSGFADEYTTSDPAYNGRIAVGLGTGDFTEVTRGHYRKFVGELADVRRAA